MNTYRVTLTSWALWIATLILPPLLGIIIVLNFFPNNVSINIAILIILVTLTFYFQRFTSKAKIVISVTENAVAIKWISQFIFHKEKDKEILMSEIKSYKYQEDSNFDLFKLTMKNGEEISLWHSTLTTADDFKKLVTDFSQLVTQLETPHSEIDKPTDPSRSELKISREKTIYELPAAPFLAGFAIVAIIILTYTGIINSTKKNSVNFGILVPITGALFFLFKFFEYRKKNKKN